VRFHFDRRKGERLRRNLKRIGFEEALELFSVNVDFTAPMVEELDRQAQELNISRQAVKSLLRQELDRH
jgi:hypothetical protein